MAIEPGGQPERAFDAPRKNDRLKCVQQDDEDDNEPEDGAEHVHRGSCKQKLDEREMVADSEQQFGA